MEEKQMLEALKRFDTATISNAVATFPDRDTCLGLYHPWDSNWYTNQKTRVMFPELGRKCGYAVTCVYGLPDPNFKCLSVGDVLRAIDASPRPVILLIKQDYPEHLKEKNGLCGGNMATAFKSLGVEAIVSDGPSRDLEEVRAMGMQYMLTGTAAGHGPMAVKAVGVPVDICGMDVAMGEIVHLDENGAVKFPAARISDVLKNCEEIARREEKQMRMLGSTSDVDLLVKYMKGVYD